MTPIIGPAASGFSEYQPFSSGCRSLVRLHHGRRILTKQTRKNMSPTNPVLRLAIKQVNGTTNELSLSESAIRESERFQDVVSDPETSDQPTKRLKQQASVFVGIWKQDCRWVTEVEIKLDLKCTVYQNRA
ncbi:hypothetical protein DPMN_175206 [Dreissena polymorpha]|uniref:Uncharacterized protein n=1 Tax=Dreissena polymorpha TaxID=45954 RepID=A0A9D4E8L0_DREPO|nr:hypothetical protein DPMN_175206 [Dreissena polymorpha]